MEERYRNETGKPSLNEVVSARRRLLKQVSGDTSTLGMAKNVLRSRSIVFDSGIVDAALARTIRTDLPIKHNGQNGKAA